MRNLKYRWWDNIHVMLPKSISADKSIYCHIYSNCVLNIMCVHLPYSGQPIPTVEYTPAEIDTW